ncbi:MAG: ABC transporter substrate-binding protein [Pseudomonadota bacterium]
MRLALAAMTLLIATSTHAMTPPDQVVKQTVNEIVNNIQSNRALYKADNVALYKMVEDTLVPAIHVPRMSKLILGKYAKNASPDQISSFSQEFQTFLMRSYATALLEYTGDQKVNYLPFSLAEGADKVLIKAELVSAEGVSYPINLYMSNRRDTQWRAYNLDVAGINFISTYRATFKNTLEKKGIEGLIADLRSKNAA